MKSFSFLALFYFIFNCFYSNAQGCSDAGACSVGSLGILPFKFEALPSDKTTLKKVDVTEPKLALKKNKKDSTSLLSNTNLENIKHNSDSISLANSANKTLKYNVQLTAYYGSGPQATSIYTTQLESTVNVIPNKLYAQLKVPYTFIDGKLGSVNGLSDITLSLSYITLTGKNSNLSLSGGVKLPSNNANTHKDNLPLPMVYQTSLGSTDILLGAKFVYKKWDFTGGYQHSFNTTQNSYLNTTSTGSNTPDYKSYVQSNKMKRADDGIFRLTRNFRLKNTFTSAGVLLIYHLANDKITDAAGNRIEAIGSKGLTVNLNFSGVIPVSKNTDFVFVVAAPVVNRSYATDGLIRKFVIIGGIKFNVYKNKK
jgi:hypothetical protein